MKTKLQLLGLVGLFFSYSFLFSQNPDLIVANRNTNSVKIFNGDTGAFMGDLVDPGEGGLNAPQEVLFHSDGSLLVTGRFNTAILKYDPVSGDFLGNFTSGYSLDNPTKTQVGPDGYLYVSQWGTVKNKVVRFDKETGAFIDEFTSTGVPNGCGQAWDTHGNLYVARYGNGSNGNVHMFDTAGVYQGIFINSNILQGPTNIWYAEDDHFWVCDWSVGEVLRFDTLGNFVDKPITGMTTVEGFDFDETGNLYLGDWNGNAIFKFEPDTEELSVFANSGGLSAPNSVVFRPVTTNVEGIDEKQIQVKIFPNPVKDVFNLEFIGIDLGMVHINILNQEGKRLKQVKLNTHQSTIDVSNLPSGTYIYELQKDQKLLKSGKLIKQ